MSAAGWAVVVLFGPLCLAFGLGAAGAVVSSAGLAWAGVSLACVWWVAGCVLLIADQRQATRQRRRGEP